MGKFKLGDRVITDTGEKGIIDEESGVDDGSISSKLVGIRMDDDGNSILRFVDTIKHDRYHKIDKILKYL